MISPLSPIASAFYRLPYPLRIGLAVLGLTGVIYGFSYYVRSFLYGAGYVVLVGIVAVILLLLLFRWFLRWRARRRAEGLGQALESHGSGAPEEITQASARARLDLLRKSFEQGIGKFRATGKNVYTLPWYVIVGETGSGKTEAIRHSSIGFPPSLHDPQQGVGGTINMDWWLTDRAVILDMAGRVVFEEVESASTSEWLEFLKLLRTYRRNCPLNGLFLVIPADTIITDNANQINAKAQKIAEQLHLIQRTLGVRFPVFVIITKCDRITGFREFFENITDPKLQAQMVGWSNPARLDEHFNAELIDQHLRVVWDRLRCRRLSVLRDPVHTEDPNARRTDQIDSLFAFPRSLSRTASRLQQYLTTVFAGGEWTGKPLFLRGIYFTSAVREGDPLDEELAQALDVPIESIQDNKAWERERSYFLKDVFTAKAFREQSLVTGAIHVSRQHRFRQAVVAIAGLASVLTLGLLTWYGARSLKRTIGARADYWEAAAGPANWCPATRIKGPDGGGELDYWRPVLAEHPQAPADFRWSPRPGDAAGDPQGPRAAESLDSLIQTAATPIEVPWIFWLAARRGRHDLHALQAKAQRRLVHDCVLRPALDAARRALIRYRQTGGPAQPPRPWSPRATEGLIHLVRLEGPEPDLVGLAPLFRFVLQHDQVQTDRYTQDAKLIKAALQQLSAAGTIRPADVGTGSKYARNAIDIGVEAFIGHWTGQARWTEADLGRIAAFRDALGRFRDAEKLLLEVDDQLDPAPDEDAVRRKASQWAERLANLARERARVDAQLAAFADGSILAFFDRATRPNLDAARARFDDFRKRTGIAEAIAADDAKGQPWLPLYKGIHDRLNEALRRLQGDDERAVLVEGLKTLDRDFLHEITVSEAVWKAWRTLTGADPEQPPPAAPTLRLYAARMLMYLLADAERLAGDDDIPDRGGIPQALGSLDAKIRKALDGIVYLRNRPGEQYRYRFDDAADVSSFLCTRLAQPQRTFTLLQRRLAKAPRNAEQVAADVLERARLLPPLAEPRVPLTDLRAGHFKAACHPAAVVALLTECGQADEAVQDVRDKRQVIPAHAKTLHDLWLQWHNASRDYVQGDYHRYWASDVPSFRLKPAVDWPAFQRELGQIESTRDVVGKLVQIGKAVEDALSGDVLRLVEPDTQRRFRASIAKLKANLDKYTGAPGEIHIRQCATVLDKWRALDGTAIAARTTLLALGGNETIKTACLPFTYSAPEEIVDRYWAELTIEGLRRMVPDICQEAERNLRLLARNHARFPLAMPSGDQEPLTPKGLDEARRLAATLATGQRAGLGLGATEADRLLDRLRTLGLTPGQLAWIARAQTILDAIPAGRDALKCRISITRSQPGDRATFSNTWVEIGARQGRRDVGREQTFVAGIDDLKLGDVACPGEAIELMFYRDPSDRDPDRAFTVPGPWAALLLLLGGQDAAPTRPGDPGLKIQWKQDTEPQAPPSEPSGAEPAAPRFGRGGAKPKALGANRHTVVITLPDKNNRPLMLRLGLTFERPLPRLRDWPAGLHP